jgi:hypothetical protein
MHIFYIFYLTFQKIKPFKICPVKINILKPIQCVQDRLLSMPGEGGKNFGLSSRSALNDRYFADNKSTTRSKSLDNLLPVQPTTEENFFGLSESRLNQRYLSQVQ